MRILEYVSDLIGALIDHTVGLHWVSGCRCYSMHMYEDNPKMSWEERQKPHAFSTDTQSERNEDSKANNTGLGLYNRFIPEKVLTPFSMKLLFLQPFFPPRRLPLGPTLSHSAASARWAPHSPPVFRAMSSHVVVLRFRAVALVGGA